MAPKPFPFPVGVGVDVCQKSRLHRLVISHQFGRWTRRVFNRLEYSDLLRSVRCHSPLLFQRLLNDIFRRERSTHLAKEGREFWENKEPLSDESGTEALAQWCAGRYSLAT